MSPDPAASRLRCSFAADARGDPLAGTAAHARGFLLSESRLDPEIVSVVAARAAGLSYRVLLIKRPGRVLEKAQRQWAVVDSTSGAEAVTWGTYGSDEDLLDIRFEARHEAGDPSPIYLVCTHGRHDACCALRGRAVAARLAEQRPDLVWECSHIGGDRFAPNVLVLPEGLYYGRVEPSRSSDVVAAHERSEVVIDLLRGRAVFRPVVQAAQNFANTQLNKYGLQNTAAQNLANTQLNKYGLQANSANMLGNLGLSNTAQQNAAASALGNLQLGKAGAITNAASNMGNLALGGTNAATTAGTNLGNQILGGSGQQASDLSSALSSALGFGNLQSGAANNIGNQAIAGQNAQTTAASGLGNTYNQGLSGMLQALGLYPQTAQATTLGPQAEYQAGQWQQQNQQAAINDLIQRYNFGQTQPYNNLNQFLGQISGNYGGTGSMSQPYYLNQGANTASNVLGAGMGVATGIGALNSAFPAFLPWLGAAIGAI